MLICRALYEWTFASLCCSKKHSQISMPCRHSQNMSAVALLNVGLFQDPGGRSNTYLGTHYCGRGKRVWWLNHAIALKLLFRCYTSNMPHILLAKANHMVRPNVNGVGKGLKVTWKCAEHTILLQEVWQIMKNNNAIFQLLNGMHLMKKELKTVLLWLFN